MWRSLVTDIADRMVTLGEWHDDDEAQLYTDASTKMCSAVLIQNGRIIALASRKLSPRETRYSTTDREHLGLVLATKKFRLFLHRHSAPTQVLSDHTALLNRKWCDLTPRQARWKMDVEQWIPHLTYVKGKNNPADYFSRWNVEVPGAEIQV